MYNVKKFHCLPYNRNWIQGIHLLNKNMETKCSLKFKNELRYSYTALNDMERFHNRYSYENTGYITACTM